MARNGQLVQDNSVLTLQQQPPDNFNHLGSTPGNTQDVISLQYLELEEFLLENSQCTVVQQNDSKVFLETTPAVQQQQIQEKQYQINLEHRVHPFNHGQQQQHQFGNTVLGGQQQQPHHHHPQQILPDPNSPPQSNCDSPPQEGQRSPVTRASTMMANATHARKSYPRRMSTSSNASSSALVVTPPHTPQQPSPPLRPTGIITDQLQDDPNTSTRKRRPVKRSRKESVAPENKDDKYWRRRAKNNEAAKRSRDLRREKENHIMQRVTFLEKENRLLHQELDTVKMENEELRDRLSRFELQQQQSSHV